MSEESVPSVPFVASSVPWLFSEPELAARFCAAGRSWVGTPFAGHSRAKGVGGGIDCVGFIEEWFAEAVPAAPRFNFPRSDADYKSHCHNTKILEYLRGQHPDPQSKVLAAFFQELTDLDTLVPVPKWPDNLVRNTGLMTGDLLVIKAQIPGVWHLPAMLDDRSFLHCAYPLGVTEADITQHEFRSRLKAAFRARAPS